MRVSDIIAESRGPSYSFEIIPPPRGRSIRDVIEIVQALMPLRPKWFDVTSHSSSAIYQEYADGTVKKQVFKKRPGTLGICGVIQNRFKIDTVAHVLCLGFNREETEDALIELSYLGVENLLLLRGDNPNFEKRHSKEKSVNLYASDLVRQVVDLRDGRFLSDLSDSERLDFCIGVAGYPEKHFEAANLEVDIKNLAQKVGAGADYVISQMFFDNAKFHDFVKKCRESGITVPIIPGLKVVKSVNQLKSIPRTFHVDLPPALVDEIQEDPDHVTEIGVRWARRQVEDLLNKGHQNIHFYVMNDADLVMSAIKGLT